MTRLRLALMLGLVSPIMVTPAAAQIPGESAFGSKGNVHEEVLARASEEVRRDLGVWNTAINQRDLKRLRQLVAPDVFLGPSEGWVVRGSEAVDSLVRYAPRMSGYFATIIDFDASGSMAYVYASVRYQFSGPKGQEFRDIEASIVLVQRGDVWKIRSYVERPRLDLAPR